MGSGRFSADDWKTYATKNNYDTKSTTEIFNKTSVDPELNPKDVIRESRDSADNPNSTPVIVGLDVTGSMSYVLDAMARQGLPTLCTEIYNRKPVADPHIMALGIGDFETDRGPLQATQFEADIRIAQQLEKIWLERGGGGNSYESYAAAWYFAAFRTKTDSFEKRGKKGYLFTVGDEYPTPKLTKEKLEQFVGGGVERDFTAEELLTAATRQWEVFHVIVEEGSHAQGHSDTFSRWVDVLGQRVIRLSDHKKLAEVLVSVMQVNEGTDHHAVTSSWDGSTALVVSKAVKDLSVGSASPGTSTGVVTL